MQNSDFQLINQKLIHVDYMINDVYVSSGSGIPLDLDYHIEKNIDEENRKAIVDLNLKIFNKDNIENYPFYFDIKIRGWFSWESSNLNSTYFDVNAPAALMAYLRPVVSQLTSFSGYPPLILPLVNFKKNDNK